MLKLYTVHRAYGAGVGSQIAICPTREVADRFKRECERLNSSTRLWVEETYLTTYGMPEETRRELFAAVNPILAGH